MFRLPRLYPILDIDLCRERGIEPLALLAAFLAGKLSTSFMERFQPRPSNGRLAEAV